MRASRPVPRISRELNSLCDRLKHPAALHLICQQGLGSINSSLHELAYNIVFLCPTSDIEYDRWLLSTRKQSLVGRGYFAESMDRAFRTAQPRNSGKGWRSLK